MIRIISLLILILGFNNLSKAQFVQPNLDSVSLSKTLISLDLITPGLSIEKRLRDNKSIHLRGTASFSYLISSGSSSGTESSYVLVPVMIAQYRSYYNLKKRARRFSNIEYNSGNFLGFHVSYQIEPIAGKNTDLFESEGGFLLGPVWGLQRNGTLTFGFNVVLGYFTGNQDPGVTPFLNLKLGLNLSKL